MASQWWIDDDELLATLGDAVRTAYHRVAVELEPREELVSHAGLRPVRVAEHAPVLG